MAGCPLPKTLGEIRFWLVAQGCSNYSSTIRGSRIDGSHPSIIGDATQVFYSNIDFVSLNTAHLAAVDIKS